MKIKFLATAQSPQYYSFDGEVITAHNEGVSKTYDLSGLEVGDKVVEVEEVGGVKPIRSAERTESGDLEVKLVQAVGPGHWSESDWFESEAYDPDSIHVKMDKSKPYSGQATVKTRQGIQKIGA